MTDEDAAKLPPNVWKAYALGAYIAIKLKRTSAYEHAQGLARGWFEDWNPFDPDEVN